MKIEIFVLILSDCFLGHNNKEAIHRPYWLNDARYVRNGKIGGKKNEEKKPIRI